MTREKKIAFQKEMVKKRLEAITDEMDFITHTVRFNYERGEYETILRPEKELTEYDKATLEVLAILALGALSALEALAEISD